VRVAAAKRAAEEARSNLWGAEAAGSLLFDCVCRGMILKEQFDRGIDAVRSVFPDTPIAGLVTYGENARPAPARRLARRHGRRGGDPRLGLRAGPDRGAVPLPDPSPRAAAQKRAEQSSTSASAQAVR